MQVLMPMHRRVSWLLTFTAASLALGSCIGTRVLERHPGPLHEYALMQSLNAELLASRSATATLRDWCARHHLAATPEIEAQVLPGEVPASSEQRVRLMVSADEPLSYRRVRLRCGTRLMSEAENWYVPSRLTADMNRQLEVSRIPFGRVIESLQPYRRNFQMQVLWPFPGRDDQRPVARTAMFEHRAIVYSALHVPLAEVREIYQSTALP
jgi:chorismate-pyruvate lyase